MLQVKMAGSTVMDESISFPWLWAGLEACRGNAALPGRPLGILVLFVSLDPRCIGATGRDWCCFRLRTSARSRRAPDSGIFGCLRPGNPAWIPWPAYESRYREQA